MPSYFRMVVDHKVLKQLSKGKWKDLPSKRNCMGGRTETGHSRCERPGNNQFALKDKWSKDINFKNQLEGISIFYSFNINLAGAPNVPGTFIRMGLQQLKKKTENRTLTPTCQCGSEYNKTKLYDMQKVTSALRESRTG